MKFSATGTRVCILSKLQQIPGDRQGCDAASDRSDSDRRTGVIPGPPALSRYPSHHPARAGVIILRLVLIVPRTTVRSSESSGCGPVALAVSLSPRRCNLNLMSHGPIGFTSGDVPNESSSPGHRGTVNVPGRGTNHGSIFDFRLPAATLQVQCTMM